jgi:predicted SprT family Zn-dependent metalloprotease
MERVMPSWDFTPVSSDHPVAKELEREKGIAELARQYMDHYGLDDWTFAFSNDIHTVGWCSYKHKTIKYSKKYTHHDWKEIEDTLLHEIAHALVGPKVKAHGVEWRRKAREVGARPETCAESHVTPKDVPAYKYVIKCPTCDRKWYRHRMRRRNFGSRCPSCQVQVQIFEIKGK